MTFTPSDLSVKINDYLSSLKYTHEPVELYHPIEYTLNIGGKRVRPVLMLLAYNMYADNVEAILPQAAAIEIYHNYTLLHDDLMDKADMRRGKATVHKLWNDNAAILSGDAMLVLAYKYMSECDSAKLKYILDVFTKTALEICEGQQWDVQFENMNEVEIDDYIEMIRLKTSVLLGAALKIGGIMAGASEEDIEKLYEFGIKIGLAFQLQDDYLDVYGNPKVFGKNIGGDIISNKKTFMLLSALNDSNSVQNEELRRWINSEECIPHEKIEAVTAIYNQLHIDQKCNCKIEQFFNEGLQIMDSLNVASDKKKELRNFVLHLMDRKL